MIKSQLKSAKLSGKGFHQELAYRTEIGRAKMLNSQKLQKGRTILSHLYGAVRH